MCVLSESGYLVWAFWCCIPWHLQPCTSQESFLQLFLWSLDLHLISSLLKFLLYSLCLVWHFLLDLIIFFFLCFSFNFSEFLSNLFTNSLSLFSVEYSLLFSASIVVLSLQFCDHGFFSPHFFPPDYTVPLITMSLGIMLEKVFLSLGHR